MGYTLEQVTTAVNAAADDVRDALSDGVETSESIRMQSIYDLVVNATLTYLESPDADLSTVAEACYSKSLNTVLGWCGAEVDPDDENEEGEEDLDELYDSLEAAGMIGPKKEEGEGQ